MTMPAEKLVLVLEKDTAMRALLKDYLVSLGIEVICWESSSEKADSPLVRQFDMAIADLQFIESDDRKLLRELRIQQPQLPLLLIGAFEKSGKRPEVANSVNSSSGPTFTLMKPFALSEMKRAVKHFLR